MPTIIEKELGLTKLLQKQMVKFFMGTVQWLLVNCHISCVVRRYGVMDWPKVATVAKQYNYQETRCRSPGSFASSWPELIIACDVRGRGLLQIEKDRHHNRVTYIASFAFTSSSSYSFISATVDKTQLCDRGKM